MAVMGSRGRPPEESPRTVSRDSKAVRGNRRTPRSHRIEVQKWGGARANATTAERRVTGPVPAGATVTHAPKEASNRTCRRVTSGAPEQPETALWMPPMLPMLKGRVVRWPRKGPRTRKSWSCPGSTHKNPDPTISRAKIRVELEAISGELGTIEEVAHTQSVDSELEL